MGPTGIDKAREAEERAYQAVLAARDAVKAAQAELEQANERNRAAMKRGCYTSDTHLSSESMLDDRV